MINALTGMPIVAEGAVRVAPLAALPTLAAARGVSVAALLPTLGLLPDLLDDPENTALPAEVGALLAATVKATGCEHLALLASAEIRLDSLGPIGGLALGARDVGAALRGLIMALHLHDRVTVPALEVGDDHATLSTIPLGATIAGAGYIADLTVGACFNILRGLCGPQWRATAVHLARRAPPDARPWINRFRVTPSFNAERNAVVFDAAWLKRPVEAGAVPTPAPTPALSLESVGAQHPLDPPARIRRTCVRAIIEGYPTVDRLARLEGLSRRTLNRELAAFGTTAQAELTRVKLAIARQLLEGTDLSLTRIAHMLGYTDGSAFTRAFRSGEGQVPSQWRAARSGAARSAIDRR